MSIPPPYKKFDKSNYHWSADIDYKKHPEEYKVGKGEQGVLICQPYKNEIGQYWRFKSPEIALESSNKIYALFLYYLEQNDFVGSDMARKYLQMGFTRARRYANYKGGLKYDKADGHPLEKGSGDLMKAQAAKIFQEKWRLAESNEKYTELKKLWKKTYG